MARAKSAAARRAQSRRRVAAAAGVVALALLAVLAVVFGPELSREVGDLRLAQEVGADEGDPDLAEPPEGAPYTVAWLQVDGTRVNYPVMQATTDDPEWWLTHAPDGSYDSEGSLFFDFRSSESCPNAMVYGHHIGNTGRMFSDLHGTWRQSVFDGLGEARLTTAEGAKAYLPLFSIVVDKSYPVIQEFEDGMDVPGLLLYIGASATARTDSWETKAANAEEMLTLVTCASSRSGQRERTLTVFCR